MIARRLALIALMTLVGGAVPCRNVQAGADIGGRFWLTYQQYKEPREEREYFIQHYEAVLRDKLFEQNNLRLTFYFDNSDNLTENLTYRRYRGHLDLTHRYYSFAARYEPRQKVTALELSPVLEAYRNQLSLDIHVPRAPRLLLSYNTRSQYLDEARTVDVLDLRADLSYRYRFVDLRANRWRSDSRNTNGIVTDVTGASVRALKSFSPWVSASGGYEFSLTESDRNIGPKTTTTNHTISGSVSWRYRHLMNAIATGSTRLLTTEHVLETRTRNDNTNLIFSFLPTRHLRPEVSHTYVGTERDGSLVTSNYASLQLLADGEVWRRTWGRAQVTRRVDIDTRGGVLPNHIYLVALRSSLYQGIDVRAELNSYEAVHPSDLLDRFQSSSILEFYLLPWQSMNVTPYARYINRGDQISFVGNDQSILGITATYSPRFPRMSVGFDANRNELTTGRRRLDISQSVNVSLYLRERSTFNVSYGVRETEYYGPDGGYGKANTLNLQGQVWLTRRGSLSMVYTGIDRKGEANSDQFAVTFRQDL